MFYYPTKDIKKDCEPIIFIHGTGMDHSVWTLPVRYFLRKKREVLAIDLPGPVSYTHLTLPTTPYV